MSEDYEEREDVNEILYELLESHKALLENHTPREYDILDGYSEEKKRHLKMREEEDNVVMDNGRRVIRMAQKYLANREENVEDEFEEEAEDITDCDTIGE